MSLGGGRPGRGNSRLVRDVTLGSRAHPGQGARGQEARASCLLPPFGPCRFSVVRRLPQSPALAMLPPLCPLQLLTLGLGLAGALSPSDPNTCSFWER